MWNLIISNLKRMFLDKRLLLGVFLFPLMVISLIAFVSKPNAVNKTKVAYSDAAKNSDSTRLIDDLSSKYELKEKSEADLLDAIKTNKVAYGIILSSSEPYITVYKGSNTDDTMIKNDITFCINAKNTTPIFKLKEKNISSNTSSKMLISLIINFCLFSSIYIAQELHSLKEKKLLKRLFSTPNTERNIIGSILICFFIILSLQFLIFNIVVSLINKAMLVPNIFGTAILFLSYVSITISLGIIVARICESSASVPAIVNAIVIPFGVVSGTFMPKSFLPEIIQKLSFLAPQYWLYDGIEKLSQNNLMLILPNVCVLVLLSLTLFLLGTIKSVEFIK